MNSTIFFFALKNCWSSVVASVVFATVVQISTVLFFLTVTYRGRLHGNYRVAAPFVIFPFVLHTMQRGRVGLAKA